MTDSPQQHPSVCVIGSGWQFTSGISYFTCRLTTALAAQRRTSALLMRRLIPRRLYPGADRVGKPGFGLPYPPDVPVFNGVDWFWLPSMVRAIRFLRRERPDVVVFQWWTGAVLHSYLLLAFVARRLGSRVVVEFHEVQDTGEARLFGVARYVAWAGKQLFGRADAWVVHSEFDRVAVRQHYGGDGREVAVIPHGPFDQYVADGSTTPPDRSDDGAGDGDRVVLFFGTIRPYKGLEHLVRAFDALPPEVISKLRLLIVGETWEGWHEPLDLVARSPHRDRIEVVNRYVRDDEVAAFFERADVVALPYTRSSASGPLHIAMSHGLPILVTDVGGLRDGAGDYAGITWLEPASVESITAALRTAAGSPSQRFADSRTWQHSADAYGDLFKAIGT